MSRLVDHAILQQRGRGLRLDDIRDQEVQVLEASIKTTEYGDCGLIKVALPTGEVQEVATFAYLVLDAIQHAVEANALPCAVTFRKSGRAWTME